MNQEKIVNSVHSLLYLCIYLNLLFFSRKIHDKICRESEVERSLLYHGAIGVADLGQLCPLILRQAAGGQPERSQILKIRASKF